MALDVPSPLFVVGYEVAGNPLRVIVTTASVTACPAASSTVAVAVVVLVPSGGSTAGLRLMAIVAGAGVISRVAAGEAGPLPAEAVAVTASCPGAAGGFSVVVATPLESVVAGFGENGAEGED